MRYFSLFATFASVWLVACSDNSPPPPPPPPPPVPSNLSLGSTFNGKRIGVHANPIYGNAIFHITINDVPVIDHTDHGRELQIAWQLNDRGEGENPTEAGSAADMNNPISSTHVISASVQGQVLTTSVNPAYWLAFQGKTTSPHTFNKTVTLTGNVLSFENEIKLVGDQRDMYVEGITAYMPPSFTRFFHFDDQGNRTEVGTAFAMYSGAVAAATADGSLSVGCHGDVSGSAAGLLSGVAAKIDCAWFAVSDARAGSYPWTVATVVGSLDEVSTALRNLMLQRQPQVAFVGSPIVSCTVARCPLPKR